MTEETKTEMTGVQAIKNFFEMGPQEALKEIKALSKEERVWFSQESAKALGVTLKAGPE